MAANKLFEYNGYKQMKGNNQVLQRKLSKQIGYNVDAAVNWQLSRGVNYTTFFVGKTFYRCVYISKPNCL